MNTGLDFPEEITEPRFGDSDRYRIDLAPSWAARLTANMRREENRRQAIRGAVIGTLLGAAFWIVVIYWIL